MSEANMHIPVLLKETLYYLNPKPNENFVDCTLGDGGHALSILRLTEPGGKLLGIDWSREAITRITKIKNKKPKIKNRLILVNDNFANLKKVVALYKFKPIHGILLDLGLSSWLLEESGKGFSFLKDEPLDMRYADPPKAYAFRRTDIPNVKSPNAYLTRRKPTHLGVLTAEIIVNHWPEKNLATIFRKYGQERYAKKIARAICREREKGKIETSRQLADLIQRIIFHKKKLSPRGRPPEGRYPAGSVPSGHLPKGDKSQARIFQALRIVVNNELENIKKVLPEAIDILEPGGRIAIISYHSLEDRIVKRFFIKASTGVLRKIRIVTKKPIRPSPEERNLNPRSRSGKLRVAEKI